MYTADLIDQIRGDMHVRDACLPAVLLCDAVNGIMIYMNAQCKWQTAEGTPCSERQSFMTSFKSTYCTAVSLYNSGCHS